MTVRNYGPTAQAVVPTAADKVTVLYPDGTVPTFSTPVAIDGSGNVSFAIDDAGDPPIDVIITVQNAEGGSKSTARARLGPDGTAPTVTAGAGAGVATGLGVTGHDDGGVVSLTTPASGTAAGALAHVVFAAERSAAPDSVVLTAANDASAAADAEVRNVTATGFDVYVRNAPAASTAYAYEFSVNA